MNFRPILVLSFLFFGASQADSWQITPSSGSSGTPVTVTTNPCSGSDPAVVLTGSDGGALLDNLKTTDSGLKGEVGMTARAFEGSVEVWCGRSVELSARSHRGSLFSYVPQSATWFVASKKETLGTFVVEEGTPNTVLGIRQQDDDSGGGIDVNVPLIPSQGEIFPSVRVDIMIDGGINNNNNSDSDSSSTGGGQDRFIAALGKLDIVVIPNSPFPVGHLPEVAGDLAQLLNTTFGNVGLNVTSNGDQLTFTLGEGVEVQRGFILLRVLSGGS